MLSSTRVAWTQAEHRIVGSVAAVAQALNPHPASTNPEIQKALKPERPEAYALRPKRPKPKTLSLLCLWLSLVSGSVALLCNGFRV